jgi:hypothetical protein
MDEVRQEAKRRGIEVIAAPTVEVCQLLEEVKKGQAYAIRANRGFGRLNRGSPLFEIARVLVGRRGSARVTGADPS